MTGNALRTTIRFMLADGLGVEDIALRLDRPAGLIRKCVDDFRKRGELVLLYRNARRRAAE